MKRNNLYEISERFKVPASMQAPLETMGFHAQCRRVKAGIVMLASAILAVFALGVFGAM